VTRTMAHALDLVILTSPIHPAAAQERAWGVTAARRKKGIFGLDRAKAGQREARIEPDWSRLNAFALAPVKR